MTIIDRYLLKLFFKIFLICFASFAGLFVVIHIFSNLDELISASEADGLTRLMIDFYAPRLLDIFDRTAGILVLIAAIFAISFMQRRREMTAIQAAGISRSRIVRPILIASLAIIGISILNREFVLPKFQEQLVRTANTWTNEGSVPMPVHHDVLTGMVFRGEQLFIEEQKITQVAVQFPSNRVSAVESEWGVITPASKRRPAGLWLHQVTHPEDLSKQISVFDSDGNPVVLFPSDQKGLGPRQCFVVCDLNVRQLAFGKKIDAYKTLPELMTDLRKPRLWFGNSQQVLVHARILRPFLDLTLLLLGLPLVVGRPDQNIFTAAGSCLIVVITFQLTTLAFHNLGSTSIIRPAALAAWLPLIVFLPLTVLSMRRLDK